MYNNIKYKLFIIDICVGRKVSQHNSKNITDHNLYNGIIEHFIKDKSYLITLINHQRKHFVGYSFYNDYLWLYISLNIHKSNSKGR